MLSASSYFMILRFLLFFLLLSAAKAEVRVFSVPPTFFSFLTGSFISEDPFADEEKVLEEKLRHSRAASVVKNPLPDLFHGLALDIQPLLQNAGVNFGEGDQCLYFPSPGYILVSGGTQSVAQVGEVVFAPDDSSTGTVMTTLTVSKGSESFSGLLLVCHPGHIGRISSPHFTLEVEPVPGGSDSSVNARFKLTGKDAFQGVEAEGGVGWVYDRPIKVASWTQKHGEQYTASLTFSLEVIPKEFTQQGHLEHLAKKAAAALAKDQRGDE